jgi:phage terminase small subunit
VLRELAKLGFSDMREVAAWGPYGLRWKDSGELTDEAAACVQEINFRVEVRYDQNGDRMETGTMKVKLHDKKSALKLLGDHLGIFGFKESEAKLGEMANSFMAGIHTIKGMQLEDLSE